MVAINPEVSLHSSNSAIFLGYRAPRYCFLHRICLVKLRPKLVKNIQTSFAWPRCSMVSPWFPNIKWVGWPFHVLRMFSVPFPHPRPHGTWSPFVSPCAQESTKAWLKNGVLKGSCQARRNLDFLEKVTSSIPDAPWCWNIYLQNWAIFGVNVGKYSIHGASGYIFLHLSANVALPNCFHKESRRTRHPPIL